MKAIQLSGFFVTPINDITNGIISGAYVSYDQSVKKFFINGQFESKWVYVAGFNEKIKKNDCIEELHEHGFIPCRNAPNYLLGLFAKFKSTNIFVDLELADSFVEKWVIALEPLKALNHKDSCNGNTNLSLCVVETNMDNHLMLVNDGDYLLKHHLVLAERIVSKL